MTRRVRVDINGDGLGFHGDVSEPVARAMLLAMTTEETKVQEEEAQQHLFPTSEDGDAFLEALVGAERTLYVRARERRGDADAYLFVIEERDPEQSYHTRLMRMPSSERTEYAELAAREGRAAAVRAMHEALLERPA